MSSEVLNRILRARAALLQMAPFFGVLSRQLTPVVDSRCKSMWTDTVSLGYNPKYVESASIIEIQAILCKLVMQVAAGHAWRQGQREGKLWNMASTYAVMPSVKAMGLVYPGSLPERAEFEGKSAEGIYLVLQAEEQDEQLPAPQSTLKPAAGSPEGSSNSDRDKGASGDDVEGHPNDSPEEGLSQQVFGEIRPAPTEDVDKLATSWATAVKSASTLQGNLPGHLVNQLKDALIKPLPWKRELQQFARNIVGNGRYTFSKPNRNHLHRGIILPTRGKKKRIGTLVVARDTSGSTFGGPYLGMFNSAILEMIETISPERVFVIDVDTRVTNVQVIAPSRHEQLKRKAHGGGGTKFAPAFEWVQSEGIHDVAALVYLTDMLGKFPAHAPPYPVLWVKTDLVCANHVKAPFGREIVLKEA